jgi:hypothetical protein
MVWIWPFFSTGLLVFFHLLGTRVRDMAFSLGAAIAERFRSHFLKRNNYAPHLKVRIYLLRSCVWLVR